VVEPGTRAIRWVRRSRPAAELLCAQLVVATAAAAINVLAARALGPVGRGELALVVLFSYLATPVVLLGVEKAYPATLPRRAFSVACRELVGLLWRPTLVVAGAILLTGLVFGPHSPEMVGYAAGVAVLTVANTGMTALRTASVSAGTGVRFLHAVCLTQAVLVTVCLLLLGMPGANALYWVVGYAAINLLPLPWLLRHGRPITGKDMVAVRRLRRRIASSTLANIVMLRADRLLIPWLSSTAELGLYASVVTMTELLYWPVQHYVDAAVPRWREANVSATSRAGPVTWWVTGYLALSGTLVVLVGQLAVVPLLGAEYASARDLVLPLVVAACCYGFSRIWFGLHLAAGRPGAASSIDVSGGLVMIIGCVVLVPAWGAFGAALASAFAYGAGAVVSLLTWRFPLRRRSR
jgi:O-antigen/teichoic acid export membrane protein